jgi:hypothetical protein
MSGFVSDFGFLSAFGLRALSPESGKEAKSSAVTGCHYRVGKAIKSGGHQFNFWRILCQKWLAVGEGFVTLLRYNFL